jgi:hypothetical protein
MSRKRRVVEIAVTVGLLAGQSGCISAWPDEQPYAVEGSGTPIPEGVDYLGAVNCGGLLWALQAAEYRTYRSDGLSSMTGLYIEWAEARARETGQDATKAKPDMAAVRDNILATTGGDLSPAMKAAAIRADHAGEVKACSQMAEDADFIYVIVGG